MEIGCVEVFHEKEVIVEVNTVGIFDMSVLVENTWIKGRLLTYYRWKEGYPVATQLRNLGVYEFTPFVGESTAYLLNGVP